MGCIVALIVFYFFSCFMGWYLCDINPNDTYSWYSGIWHGLFLYLIGLEVGLGMPCIRLIIIQQGIMFGGG